MKRRNFIKITSLGVGLLTLKPNKLLSFDQNEQTDYLIKIIYNNINHNSELEEGGGFCALIETNYISILFDTGGDSLILSNNIKKSRVDLNKIRAIVLSHNHWDHVYGLPGVVDEINESKIFVPHSFENTILEQNPGINLVSIKESCKIISDIWTTGEMYTKFLDRNISEQSIIINKPKEIAILTGCAHPGIVKIVKQSKSIFSNKSINLLAGGFHLRSHTEQEVKNISDELKALGVKRVAPSHCTGDMAIKVFKEEWKNDYYELFLGDEFKF